MKKIIEDKIIVLDRQIENEINELSKSLKVVNILEYTNINSSRLVFLQGKKEALLDMLYIINNSL